MTDMKQGNKFDGGKPPLHLIPPEFLYAVAEILDFGSKKYAPRNWENGINYSRVYRAAIGHLMDWFMRKGPDAETGKSHLWHAACCVMFLVCYEEWSYDAFDDRPIRDHPGGAELATETFGDLGTMDVRAKRS